MTCSEQCRSFVGLPIATIATLFMMFAALPAPAQTFTVLHNFEGSDGWQPFAGLTIDPAGNLYGTTQYGGILNCDGGGPAGCGVAYKLKKLDSSWVLSVLNEFQGREDFLPTDPGTITLGPGGVPYGVQAFGGTNEAGLLFQLQPPVTAPRTANAPWSYAVDWAYDSGNDGGQPSQVTFDPAGNIWGAEGDGGPPGAEGIVYELTPSASGWNQTIIYSFLDPDGYEPAGPVDVSLDPSGNIYGVTRAGGNQQCGGGGCGTVYELTHTSSGWSVTYLHVFQQDTEGGDPGPLVRDSSGNLFGLTCRYASDNGGTIWELSPSGSGWVFTVLYSFPWQTQEFAGPFRPVIGADGALYGVNNWGGANDYGSVYKLAPAGSSWNYTDVYSFTGGADGCYPRGPVALDPAGNVYGTTQQCALGGGDVWEVVP